MDNQEGRIKAARSFAGLDQKQLAERLGVETKWVWRREQALGHKDRQDAKRYELLAIAVVCGVPYEYVMDPEEIGVALGRGLAPADAAMRTLDALDPAPEEPAGESEPGQAATGLQEPG